MKAKQAEIEEICTLKIRSQNGQIYLLRMERQNKMIDVVKELQNVVKDDFRVMAIIHTGSINRKKQKSRRIGIFPEREPPPPEVISQKHF